MRNVKITADDAKRMLMNRNKDMEAIDHKMVLLYGEMGRLESSNELLRAVAMPGKPAGMPRGGGGDVDNLDVLIRYNRQKQDRSEEIRRQMWALSQKAEDIRRLWNCFLALDEPYYGILYELYVKKELYAVVQCQSGYSHRLFEDKRREGLKLLAGMFNSDRSALELMELQKPIEQKKEGRKKTGCPAAYPGQMELPLDRLSG